MFAQDLLVDLSVDAVYTAVLRYLQDFPLPEFSVVGSAKPSYIEAKFSSLRYVQGSVFNNYPMGTAKIAIGRRDEKSQITINYNFGKFIAYYLGLYLTLGVLIYATTTAILPVIPPATFALIAFYFFMGLISTAVSINRVRDMFKYGISGYLKCLEQLSATQSMNRQIELGN